MSDAPERICAYNSLLDGYTFTAKGPQPHFDGVEYIRADLADLDRAELVEACEWVLLAAKTLAGYNRDLGVELPDTTEIGRIYESRDTPSFRISVGHIRRLSAALAKIKEQQA